MTIEVDMIVTPVPENPYISTFNNTDSRWIKMAGHYHCVLRTKLGEHSFYYSVGPGILANDQRVKAHLHRDSHLLRAVTRGVLLVNPVDIQIWGRAKKLYKPSLDNVLETLVIEVDAFNIAGSFEEWAKNCGFDPDSRRAYRLWKHTKTIVDKFDALFSFEEWKELKCKYLDHCP